ncbi:MAG: GNAT family N-acetyltransferase [Williamsia sp.]|nr:GNAT family N-acetyltransferase [Williamsia sp.]
MEINCGDFLLRPFRMSDQQSMARYANNHHIWRNVRDRFPHPYTLEDAVAFLQPRVDTEPVTDFCIDYRGECIGAMGILLQQDVHRKSAEFGYWLAEPFWGRGIATTAAQNLIPHIWKRFDLVRLYACIFAYNKASMRVLEKAGFRFECIFEKAVFKDNQLVDEHRYCCLNQDYTISPIL